jgi:hypothetical protein
MNGDGALLGDPNGADLRSLPGMATGPCAGQAGACQVDTFAWSPERAEYWVAHGTTTWALDGTGALKSVAPHASFPTLLAGPCDGRATGDCKLQAYDWADGGFVIINDGRLWRFDAALNPVGPSTALTSYGGGTMCAALGGNCAIDDFTWRSDIKQFHIIAGGRAWFADASGNLVGNSGAELKTISGFAQGPCR